MRRLWSLSCALFLLAACGQEPQGGTAPTSPPETPDETESPTPTDLPGASCDDRTGGDARNLPNFVKVEVESEGGVDRVTFQFELNQQNVKQPPYHVVRFQEELHTDPEGAPADIEGEAFILVVFGALGVDLSGEEPEVIYTGPKEFTPGFGTVQEVEELGDFEATISWGIGLAAEQCFVLDAGPDHLTLEFPSA
jgi:hypothetical protein